MQQLPSVVYLADLAREYKDTESGQELKQALTNIIYPLFFEIRDQNPITIKLVTATVLGCCAKFAIKKLKKLDTQKTSVMKIKYMDSQDYNLLDKLHELLSQASKSKVSKSGWQSMYMYSTEAITNKDMGHFPLEFELFNNLEKANKETTKINKALGNYWIHKITYNGLLDEPEEKGLDTRLMQEIQQNFIKDLNNFMQTTTDLSVAGFAFKLWQIQDKSERYIDTLRQNDINPCGLSTLILDDNGKKTPICNDPECNNFQYWDGFLDNLLFLDEAEKMIQEMIQEMIPQKKSQNKLKNLKAETIMDFSSTTAEVEKKDLDNQNNQPNISNPLTIQHEGTEQFQDCEDWGWHNFENWGSDLFNDHETPLNDAANTTNTTTSLILQERAQQAPKVEKTIDRSKTKAEKENLDNQLDNQNIRQTMSVSKAHSNIFNKKRKLTEQTSQTRHARVLNCLR